MQLADRIRIGAAIICFLGVCYLSTAVADEKSYFVGLRTHDFKSFGFSMQLCKEDKACIDFGVHKDALLVGVLLDRVSGGDTYGRGQLGIGLLNTPAANTIVGMGGIGIGWRDGLEASYKIAFDREKIVMSGFDIGVRFNEDKKTHNTNEPPVDPPTEPPEPPTEPPTQPPIEPPSDDCDSRHNGRHCDKFDDKHEKKS